MKRGDEMIRIGRFQDEAKPKPKPTKTVDEPVKEGTD